MKNWIFFLVALFLISGFSPTIKPGENPESITNIPRWNYYNRSLSNNFLRWSGSKLGSDWYNDSLLGNSAETDKAPDAVFFNNKIFLFYRGNTSSKIYVSYSTDGSNWLGNFSIGESPSTTGPGAVVFNGQIFVFFVYGNLINYYVSSNGLDYSGPYSISQDIAIQSPGIDFPDNLEPAAISAEGYIFLFFVHGSAISVLRTEDGIGWTDYFYGQFPGEQTLDGLTATYVNDEVILCFSGRYTKKLREKRASISDYGDLFWTTGTAEAPQILGAYTDEKPDIAASINGTSVVVYKGLNSNEIFYAISYGNGWYGNNPAYGATNKGLGIVNTDGG